jgi:hypothetical protein
MASELRSIDPSPLRARYTGPASSVGERPELQWIKIAKLRIDPRYQREIGRRGADNILSIAPAFRWAKFAPVIVAPIGGGLYAIVDGQHRTTAAALRGFESVPCVIIAADDAEQADAFVAINANVTAMSPLQLHAARLAAGDKSAVALTEVCLEASVTICRYPVPANKIKPGETLAVAMLQGMLDKYGKDILIAALCCITQTRTGNAGMIRAQIVEALCSTLEAEPDWCADRKRLIFAMQTFDFAARFNEARAKSIDSGVKVATILVEMIGDHLSDRFERIRTDATISAPPTAKAAPKAPPVAPAMPTGPGTISVGREEVSYKGRRQRCTPRAAQLVGLLAKAKPNPIGDEFLIGKLWTVRPANAGEYLDGLVNELGSLKRIGLDVRSLRGIGRQIVEIEA